MNASTQKRALLDRLLSRCAHLVNVAEALRIALSQVQA